MRSGKGLDPNNLHLFNQMIEQKVWVFKSRNALHFKKTLTLLNRMD